MSYDLAFFANTQQGVRADEVREAFEALYDDERLDWQCDQEFIDFFNALREKYKTLKVEFDIAEADIESGAVLIELPDAQSDELHHEIGGLMMNYSVIIFDPQTDRVLLELEDID